MDFKQRVAWAITHVKIRTGLTWPELAQRLESDKNTVAAYARGKGLIKGGVLEKLVSEFGFSSSWLLEGRGEARLYHGLPGEAEEQGLWRPIPDDPGLSRAGDATRDFRQVARVEARLSTDHEVMYGIQKNTEPYGFDPVWLNDLVRDVEHAFCLRVCDNAMRPVLAPGDLVMIDPGRRTIQSGRIYAFTPGDDMIQVRRLESRGRTVRVLCDNRAIYESFDLDADAILILGQAVWLARSLVSGG